VEYHELSHALQVPTCFSLSPTMELLSFQLNDTVVWLYRKGNERVWEIESSDSENKIIRLEWRPDGKQFAILYMNGSIELYDTMTGSLIRVLKLKMDISCLKWSRKIILPISENSGVTGILNDINIVNSLPLLHFTSKNENYNIIETSNNEKENENNLDIILTGSTNGKLCCIFAGIFIVDNIIFDEFLNCEFLDIISNDTLSDQYVLVSNLDSIKLWKINTQILSNNKEFNKILIICSKILNLIDHFKSSINKITSHYKPYIDYTIRIIELLRGEIKDVEENIDFPHNENFDNDSNNTDPIYDLYDLLLTGSLSNATKRWLTDYLSESGIKRWTKLGRNYFDNARSSVYNDLISLLHHLIVYLTDLKSMSQWNPNDSSSIYKSDIDECIKISQNFLKYSYKFMMQLNDNQRYFEQTIIWISSILAELTADEKINVTFKTNDITKYLMFINEKLNSIENNEKKENIFSNDDSKINDFTKVVDTVLNKLFSKIKADIKSNFKLDENINIADEVSSLKFLNMKKSQDHYLLIYFYLENKSIINVQKYDLFQNLQTTKYNIPINESKEIIELKIISNDKILILYPSTIVIYKISLSEETLDELYNYNLRAVSNGYDDFEFRAAHLTINEDQRLICVLDSTRKKYIWINYDF
jgi:hypothetical protein